MWQENMSLQKGKHHEDRALAFLQNQGLMLKARNFYSRHGEIDLIMHERKILVFIEVRYRKSSRFGSALESVTLQKQQKIMKTAEYYLQNFDIGDKIGTRFDVVAITSCQFSWVKNAFGAV